jgi:[ribosomal protein S18]-alanine N-acetyltransferase
MFMTPFTIKPFGLGDMTAILGLERDIFPEDTFDMIEFISLHLRGKDTFLVAHTGKKIAGYIAAYPEKETAYIASIAVDPAYRGQGLGRLLMQSVMQKLAQTGADTIGLHVREDNASAIHLYQSLGFITLETLPDYYEDGSSGLFMELAFPPPP